MSSKVFDLINKETRRQMTGLVMIPSENYVSNDVLKVLGSPLVNKYSEGYPKARYYSGNEFIDEIEIYTQELANKLFGTVHANVQPYSGSPANLAVNLALVNVGETIMGMSLNSGGHLTHGATASYSSKLFKAVQYEVGEDGRIDLKQLEQLAISHKPQVIWIGGTAYPYLLPFAEFREIADIVGAYLIADVSHIAGLIVGGVHPNPCEFVDVITTTTHKTLRGPRGAMILVTKKGLEKDPEIISKIDKAVFPGLQGGPHDNAVAALAVALEEAGSEQFTIYSQQVVKNAQVLAEVLESQTENHLMLMNLSKYGFGLGYQAQVALEAAGIFVNRNAVPNDPSSPFYPSGIRLGTPALTSRGMTEVDMKKVGGWILEVLEEVRGHDLPRAQEARREFIKDFRKQITGNSKIAEIKQEVEEFAKKFPAPGIESNG